MLLFPRPNSGDNSLPPFGLGEPVFDDDAADLANDALTAAAKCADELRSLPLIPLAPVKPASADGGGIKPGQLAKLAP